jgi:hypothetical protein
MAEMRDAGSDRENAERETRGLPVMFLDILIVLLLPKDEYTA